jgi:glucose-6-phosphate isomerase
MSNTDFLSGIKSNSLLTYDLNGYQKVVDDALKQVDKDHVVERIWDHDHTVWKESPEEITNRLAWLHLPETMVSKISEIYDLVDEVRQAGFTHALLLGMGGSSLAPELFRLIFGVKSGYLDMAILDSTDPDAIRETFGRSRLESTLYIVSTKSGGTIETMSFMKYCYNQVQDVVGEKDAGNHFIAITDPGSGLEKIALDLNFRKIFLNNPDVGGRYSALSFFGLVPAALLGVDVEVFLERALQIARPAEKENRVPALNEAVLLGTAMGVLAQAGREKLTLVLSKYLLPFGAWIEQLVAESTGKEGKGILPVLETHITPGRDYSDRFIIYLKLKGEKNTQRSIEKLKEVGAPTMTFQLNDIYDLALEFYRWEYSTAISAHFLKINPFDQPNVESAKIQARTLVSRYMEEGELPAPEDIFHIKNGISDFDMENMIKQLKIFFSEPNKHLLSKTYFSIQAFTKHDKEIDELLNNIRHLIEQKYDKATTIGYGPRFLHSTGQLHKGDEGNGKFIQIMTENDADIAIPEKPGSSASLVSFSVLKKAQAFGDREALRAEGREVITFLISGDQKKGIQEILKYIDRI